MASEAYLPYAPLSALKPVAPDLWIVDGPEIGFGLLGLDIPFPTRMTVVRLHGGELWVHSPILPTDDLLQSLNQIGQVQFLIAPNTLHYWWIPDWKARFPKPRFSVTGARAIRQTRPAGLSAARGRAADRPGGCSRPGVGAGSLLTEAVFFHSSSRTLILTDLIETFEPGRVRRRWMSWLLRWGGAASPDGKRRSTCS